MISSSEPERTGNKLRAIERTAGATCVCRSLGVFAGVGSMPLLRRAEEDSAFVFLEVVLVVVGVGRPSEAAAELIESKVSAPETRLPPVDSEFLGVRFLDAV